MRSGDRNGRGHEGPRRSDRDLDEEQFGDSDDLRYEGPISFEDGDEEYDDDDAPSGGGRFLLLAALIGGAVVLLVGVALWLRGGSSSGTEKLGAGPTAAQVVQPRVSQPDAAGGTAPLPSSVTSETPAGGRGGLYGESAPGAARPAEKAADLPAPTAEPEPANSKVETRPLPSMVEESSDAKAASAKSKDARAAKAAKAEESAPTETAEAAPSKKTRKGAAKDAEAKAAADEKTAKGTAEKKSAKAKSGADAAAAPAAAESAAKTTKSAKANGAKGGKSVGGTARKLVADGKIHDAATLGAIHAQNAPSGSYSVQVLYACKPDTIKSAFARVKDNSLFVVPAAKKNCYRLLWGTYRDRASAEAAFDAVPEYFRNADKPRLAPLEKVPAR
ncbi:MAG: hypothetical protein ABFD65_07155 [Candidatus Polarisedimenticolia bacterium]